MQPSLSWIIFSYRVQSEPSTLRVRAWRIFRRIGALALQQSVYAVPNTPEVTKKLQKLRHLIEESDGDVLWLDVDRFSNPTVERLVLLFNELRVQEYDAFMVACSELTYSAPIEECDARLRLLQKWYLKLRARDYFNCSKSEVAGQCLEEVSRQFATWQEAMMNT